MILYIQKYIKPTLNQFGKNEKTFLTFCTFGSVSIRSAMTWGGNVCLNTWSKWAGCAQTVTAFARCSTPASTSPADSNASPCWISERKKFCMASASRRSGRLIDASRLSRPFRRPAKNHHAHSIYQRTGNLSIYIKIRSIDPRQRRHTNCKFQGILKLSLWKVIKTQSSSCAGLTHPGAPFDLTDIRAYSPFQLKIHFIVHQHKRSLCTNKFH